MVIKGKKKNKRTLRSNTFVFQSFTEKLEDVNIDVHRCIKRHQSDSRLTHIAECLDKWTDLNCTEHFVNLRSDISFEVRTTVQVVHNQKNLESIIIKHLEIEDSNALQPILELTVALAEDLLLDFYSFWPTVFKSIIKILNERHHDVEALTWSFSCLGHLFRILWKKMITDMPNIFDLFCPLLSSKRSYIVEFAAKSFAFLLRKCPNLAEILKIFKFAVQDGKSSNEAVSLLLFESVIATSGRLHSKSAKVLKEILEFTPEFSHNVWKKLAEYITVQHSNQLWHPIFENFCPNLCVTILRVNPQLLTEENILPLLEKCLKRANLELYELLILSSSITFQKKMELCKAVTASNISVLEFSSFLVNISNHTDFDNYYKPVFVDFLGKHCREKPEHVMNLLVQLIQFKAPNPKFGPELKSWRKYNIRQKNIEDLTRKWLQAEDVDKAIIALSILPHLVTDENDLDIDAIELIERHKNDSRLILGTVTCLALLKKNLPSKKILEQFLNNNKNIYCLIALNLFLSQNLNNPYDSKLKRDLEENLRELLCSPSSYQRKLAAHSLSILSVTINEIMKLCVEVEEIPADVYRYRERLRILQKLDLLEDIDSEDMKSRLVVVDYLVGHCYVNLMLCWEPTTDLLANFAKSCDKNAFFEIWRKHLRRLASFCEEEFDQTEEEFQDKPLNIALDNLEVKPEHKADHENVRMLLWKAMLKFVSVMEVFADDISQFLFRFIQNEYEKIFPSNKKFENILKANEITSHAASKLDKKKTRMALKTHLNFFSKLQSPGKLMNHERLRSLYLNFLQNRDNGIQSSSLNCLLAYNQPFLISYKDPLINLLNDHKMKLAMAELSENRVEECHKEKLWNVLHRLLYGKLLQKYGRDRGGHLASITKRATIIRFLTNAPEFKSFFSLLLEYYQSYTTKLNPDKIMKEVSANVKPEKVVNLQVQLAVANTLNLLISKLEKSVMENSDIMLGILLIILEQCKTLNNTKNDLKDRSIKSLKHLKGLCLKVITRMFHSEMDTITPNKREILFVSSLTNSVETLDNEVTNVSSALKLIYACSSKKSLWNLLLLEIDDVTVITATFNLLSKKSLKKKVSDFLLELILNLLDEEDEDGFQIVKPYVNQLLDYIQRTMQKKLKIAQLERELAILAKIGKFVEDSIISENLLKLLLPLILKQKKTNNDALDSIKYLIKKCCAEKFTDNLLRLCSLGLERVQRDSLLDCLQEAFTNSKITSFIRDSNAWDKKSLEEPDYELRIKALEDLESVLKTDFDYKIKRPLIIALIHNSAYVINTIEDTVLVDRFSLSIQESLNQLSETLKGNEDYKDLVVTHLVPLVKKGLLRADEPKRHEWITIFSTLVGTHEGEFTCLRNLRSDDEEVDAFKNITHIQMYRRSKAMRKIADYVKENNTESGIVSNYVLPMFSHYVADNKYTKFGNLVDTCIESYGKLTSCLKWKSYQNQLVLSIKQIEKFKADLKNVNVRLVVSILDSYSYTTEKAIAFLTRNILSKLEKLMINKSGDEENLRVPLALAIVKLLQKLPQKVQDVHLPIVLLKLIHFLRSRTIVVRQSARETLVKVVCSLGIRYVRYIMDELQNALRRGFQKHVLSLTIFSILSALTPKNDENYNSIVRQISAVCKEELFGVEPEVKVPEAKNVKSYDIMLLLSRNIQAKTFGDLVNPFKEILFETTSHKEVNKLRRLFLQICKGLSSNSSCTIEELLSFAYNLTVAPSENQAKLQVQTMVEKYLEKKKDSFIVPTEPSRGAVKPKTTVKTNISLLQEVCFSLVVSLFKERKFEENIDHVRLLDPFVPKVLQVLEEDRDDNSLCAALRLLPRLLKMKLPTVKQNAQNFEKALFVLLEEFTLTKSLVLQLAFKALTSLIQDIELQVSDPKHLQLFVVYADANLHDSGKNVQIYQALSVLLKNCKEFPELEDIISKARETVIKSNIPLLRQSARNLVLNYTLDFPLGEKKVKEQLEFWVGQLEYSGEYGRLSALETLLLIFERFPIEVIQENSLYFILSVSSRLINDSSEKCKRLAALVTKKIFERLNQKFKDSFVAMVHKWFKSSKTANLRLAVLSLSQLLSVEGEKFQKRVSSIMEYLLEIFKADRNLEEKRVRDELQIDHLFINSLSFLIQMSKTCCLMKLSKDYPEKLYWISKELLNHPHSHVRTLASKLLGFILDSKIDSVVEENELKDVCKLNLKQLEFEHCLTEQLDQVVRNIISIFNDLKTIEKEEWVVKKLVKELNIELVSNSNLRRFHETAFKFLAAICVGQEKSIPSKYATFFMKSLIRVTLHKGESSELQNLANETCTLLKAAIGSKQYTQLYAEAIKVLGAKKLKRKQKSAELMVNLPEIGAAKKLRKNLKKRPALKRQRQLENGTLKKRKIN